MSKRVGMGHQAKRSDPKVTAAVPQELYDQLVAQADAEERTLSVVVRRALREYLERRPANDRP